MKVDVLSVMDRLIGNTRTMAGLTGDPRMRDHLADGEQARAAVAELIAAARLSCSTDRVTDGLREALACVGGAP